MPLGIEDINPIDSAQAMTKLAAFAVEASNQKVDTAVHLLLNAAINLMVSTYGPVTDKDKFTSFVRKIVVQANNSYKLITHKGGTVQ